MQELVLFLPFDTQKIAPHFLRGNLIDRQRSDEDMSWKVQENQRVLRIFMSRSTSHAVRMNINAILYSAALAQPRARGHATGMVHGRGDFTAETSAR
jgi:hypothetical protein